MLFKRQEYRFLTEDAMLCINTAFGLSYTGQDWELIEADPNRLEDFLSYYEAHELDTDEQFALISLIKRARRANHSPFM